MDKVRRKRESKDGRPHDGHKYICEIRHKWLVFSRRLEAFTRAPSASITSTAPACWASSWSRIRLASPGEDQRDRSSRGGPVTSRLPVCPNPSRARSISIRPVSTMCDAVKSAWSRPRWVVVVSRTGMSGEVSPASLRSAPDLPPAPVKEMVVPAAVRSALDSSTQAANCRRIFGLDSIASKTPPPTASDLSEIWVQ